MEGPFNFSMIEMGKLHPDEVFWRDIQPWLKERGYALRDRYQPNWVGSWKLDPKKEFRNAEDGFIIKYLFLMDATRPDGSLVMLKRIALSKDPNEKAIGTLLCSEPLASHPGNHCVPFFEVLQVPDNPDIEILVMPYLHGFEEPPFETVGEVVEFYRQIFDALKFMHENHIAHRDIKFNNIMADTISLYDSPPHPSWPSKSRDFRKESHVISSRTRTPVKYYLIDYGLSKIYKPEDAPHLENPGWGGDRTVPEFKTTDGKLCDPFPVDVYCMGNMIRTEFLESSISMHTEAKRGLEFMNDLVQDMVKVDPKERPTMTEVVSRFQDITSRLSGWKLRSRVVNADEQGISRIIRSVIHWMKQVGLIVSRVPPIPSP